jgi:serine-type D-Ala-D-Ala carboxypeptidase (penicillin-binding protein 5/6)
MRRALLAVVVLAVAFAGPVHASGTAPSRSVTGPELDAAAWYLVGADGTVLAQRNSRRARAVASITKVMTALVALEHARPSDVVRVSRLAAGVGGSTIFLRGGEEMTVASLVRGALIPSANDAATALALHVGGGSSSRFVSLMNAKAEALGLRDTTFANPHGLDQAGHVSSARDATLLVKHALGIPLLRDALSRTTFAFSSTREFETTDDLLVGWPALVGGKTGHTEDAGWSQAAAAAGRGTTVYGTVLGGETREARNAALKSLLVYGIASYRRIAAIDETRVYAEAETGYDRPAVELVAPRTVTRTVLGTKSLVERVIAPSSVELPVRKGQRLGRVEVWDGDVLVASSKLVAAEAVSEPGFLSKAGWFAERTAANLWGIFA